ncbi:MAG: hypothetical protein IJD16_05225 [Desulfovibrio sp.]|nr:hypothetical protein [Desulfovibrio sp.]
MPFVRHVFLFGLLCLAGLAGGCLFSTPTAEPQVEDVQAGQRQITSPPGHDSQTHAENVTERDI